MTNRYTIIGSLGRGGVGEVLLAEDAQLKRKVAIKRLHTEEGDEAAESLQQEATTLSSLNHPNVVTVHDVGIDEQGAYVVMEYLEGETFEDLVERGALTWEDFQSVAIQALEGLIAAQHLGLVHRDIKPGNLMIIWRPTGSFDIKLLDFGLAKFSPKPSKQTVNQGDAIMGSIFFMAPEQFERGDLDWRTDLYSLGAVFYFGLTGHYPFDGNTAPEVMAAHLEHQVNRLEELRPDVPVWACRWVHWLISRNQQDRPKDAVEALQVFIRTGEGMPESTLEGAGVRLVTSATGSVYEQPLSSTQAAADTAQQIHQGDAPAQAGSKSKPSWMLWVGIGAGVVTLLALVLFVLRSLVPNEDEQRIEELVQQGTLPSVTTLESNEKDYQLLYGYLKGGYDSSAGNDQDKTLGYAAVQAISKFQWGGTDQAVIRDLKQEGNTNALLNLMRIAETREIPAWVDHVLARFDKVEPLVQQNILAGLLSELSRGGYQVDNDTFESMLQNSLEETNLDRLYLYNSVLKQILLGSPKATDKSQLVRSLYKQKNQQLSNQQKENLLSLLTAGGAKQDFQRIAKMLESDDEQEVALAAEALEEAKKGAAAELLTMHALSLYSELESTPKRGRSRLQRRFANRLNGAMQQVTKADAPMAKESLALALKTIEEWEYLSPVLGALLERDEPWAADMLDQISERFPQHKKLLDKERSKRERQQPKSS